MIKNERLREMEEGVRDFFRTQIGIDDRQHTLWITQRRDLFALLLAIYRAGLSDGIEAAGIKKRQATKLYQEHCQLPPDYNLESVTGVSESAQEAGTT